MASALWSSLFLALMANLLPFDFSITRFAVLAAVPALVVGIVLGNYVARWWKCERVAWRHRVAVASLLALVFSCIVVPVAGMGAAALLPFRPGEPQRIWAWYLPECVRRPIAAAYVAQWPQCTFNLLGWGLLPTDIVRGFALTSGRDIRPWHAWSERDPEALSFALAVGETETPTQPAGSHDFGAGFLIGELGSADDVRMRLEGAYSDELVCGLACGLSFRLPGEQTAVPSEAFVRRFERMADQNAMEWIGTPLLVHAPERLNMYLRRCIDDPTPTNLTRLKALLYAWGQGDRDCALTVCALQSDSVELRKLALLSLRWNYLQGHARRVLSPCLLRALQARNSNTDADEQRLAMYCCEFMFSGGSLRLQAFPARVADAPIPPLDTYDNEVLGRWVKRLKEDHPIQ
jgi:hypothetical protein